MHERTADAERLGGISERAIRNRLELGIGNRVRLAAQAFPCAFARASPARYALDNPAVFELRDGPENVHLQLAGRRCGVDALAE